MAPSTLDISWLGGLLEGEGAFMMRKGSAKIALQSTDRDIVAKVAAFLGTKVDGDGWKPKGKETYKKVWACAVHGTRAISWMMILYQFLGERRQEKIRSILDQWKASRASPRASRGQKIMATCHPDRPRRAGMLCSTCWMREYRHRTGKHTKYYRSRMAIV